MPSSVIHLVILALAVVAAPCLGADNLRLLFAPASERITVGSTARIWLNWLNNGDSDATAIPPLNIAGSLIQGNSRFPVTLKIGSPYGTSSIAVAGGCFARREYFVQLPANVSGKVILEPDMADANPVALDILPGTPGAPGGAAPAATAASGGEPPAVDATSAQGAKATKPAAVRASDPVGFFQRHFSPHDPLYFVAGTESPNAKFQISFKYQLFSDTVNSWSWTRPVTNLFVGYTQTSLWDWNKPSAPFFDSSYKPEFLYSTVLWDRREPSDWVRLGLQAGVQHESNGRDGLSSRSLNNVYIRPILTLGREGGFQVTLAPKVLVYAGDMRDNRDIADYRGHLEMRGVFGWQEGIQASILGRVGDDMNRGSMQVDLSYPMWKLPVLKSSVFLNVQYFNGYGESLLLYNQRSWGVRAGFSLSR